MRGKRVVVITPLFFFYGTIYALFIAKIQINTMTDVDFIRLSALVFAATLIGKATDPVREGTEMAERLFNKLKEKEV